MIVFDCPSCKGKMQAAEEFVGKTVVCPACGAKAAIPAPETPAEAITASAAPIAPAAPAAGAITTPENVVPTRKRDDDDDRPPRRDRSDVGTAAAVGMGTGMIVLLVVGITGCVGLSVVAILVALLVPAVSKVREAAARTQTLNNLKQIGLACHNHHDVFRTFPSPKMQAQMVGGPVPDLSWRVTVLPFVDQGAMFNVFDKANAWDHANNAQFVNQRPIVYAHIFRPEPDTSQTFFQYFTGPKTLFPDPLQRVGPAQIPDGSSNTFLFAEAQTGVQWTKPADMVVGAGALPLPPDRFMAAMADGSVRMINRRSVNDDVLRLVIDPADGQALPLDWGN